MTTYYKWMLADGTTRYQKTVWPVEVGVWTPKETPVVCSSGWHAMEEKDVLAHLPNELGATLWEVEVRGKIVHGDDKLAAESMRLKWIVGTTDARNLRLFAADCAEDVLPIFYKVSPNDHRPAESIAVARRYANGDAPEKERAAAWAARAAARAAAWAARAAARAAAGDAGAAARAARAAAEFAWSAARAKYSNWLVVRLESDR